jgi:hypothetical protein
LRGKKTQKSIFSPGIYPLFLIGAAVGLLLATFMFLPAYGIIRTLLWVSSLTLMMLIPFYVIKFKG